MRVDNSESINSLIHSKICIKCLFVPGTVPGSSHSIVLYGAWLLTFPLSVLLSNVDPVLCFYQGEPHCTGMWFQLGSSVTSRLGFGLRVAWTEGEAMSLPWEHPREILPITTIYWCFPVSGTGPSAYTYFQSLQEPFKCKNKTKQKIQES